VCSFEDGPVRRDLEAMGIPVELLPRRRHGIEALPWFIAEMARIRRTLARLVIKHEIDIVQTHLMQTLDFLVLSLLRRTPLKAVLWTIHNVDFLPEGGNPWSRLKRWVHRVIYRIMSSRASGWVAVSGRVRDSILEQVGPIQKRITTIANGVDVQRFEGPGDKAGLARSLGLDASSLFIAAAGRLTEQKGHRYLVEAATPVVRAYPNAHFLLMGEGELRPELERRIQEAGLVDHVHLLGVREDLPFLLASADLFALPSLWEGFSIALLEAMAAGKPVVATAVSGSDEAMIPGETGWVVPPRDGKALADAMLEALSDPPGARAMGLRAREKVAKDFSAQKQAREYLALYRSVLSSA
jgi:glycosyltransferase involved in cell wall biosynthesis